jgi:uncharacterized C2H2 Zn-finger protein
MNNIKSLMKYTGQCVYFIYNDETHMFKIGKTACIKTTMNNIRFESDKMKLYNIIKINNDDDIDEELHNAYITFHKSRVDDEFFKINKKDIDIYIQSREYNSLINAVDNIQNYTIDDENEYICNRCKQSFERKYNYERHITRKIPCKQSKIIEKNNNLRQKWFLLKKEIK